METVEREKKKGIPLHIRMFLGFAIGLSAGLITYLASGNAPWVSFVIDNITNPIGQVFLRLLFMLVIPLLVSALVMGIAEMGEIRSLKRVGLKTLGVTLVLSTVAVVVSLLTVNILRPGDGVDRETAALLLEGGAKGTGTILDTARNAPTGIDALVNIVPSNIVLAMSQNDILAVMFFALFFGIGLVLVQTPATAALKSVFQGVFEVSMRLIGIVIQMAPIAIACFMFNLSAIFGWDILVRLSAYVMTVLTALGIQMFIIYPLVLLLVARRSPIRFFADIQEAVVMAFATASSNATLPTALRVAEQKLKLPPRISRFVLTIGATANQNGTAMFEGVTVIFLAQFFGVDLTLGQQVVVMLVCILGGIGTAGVPAGSLPVIALILGMVGVPPQGIGIVLGVDRFLDMCRTTLNVTGDLVAATLVSASEGDTDIEEDQRPEAVAERQA